jgi:O-acetylhomoserine/O-acetylserine sulfhydrylase-like pyridoxal-dependent enzyme
MTYNFDTLALHAGQVPDETFGARATPIYLTTSFVFKDSDQAAALFNMERAGHVYSRISNPTNAVLEERIAALEGGVGAIAVASGQAALHLAIATLMGAGGHIVASRSLYGGSHNLLDYTLPRFGITDHLRRSARPRRLARRDPPRNPPAVRRDTGQSRPRRAGHSHRWRRWPTSTACRCWWTAPSPRPG